MSVVTNLHGPRNPLPPKPMHADVALARVRATAKRHQYGSVEVLAALLDAVEAVAHALADGEVQEASDEQRTTGYRMRAAGALTYVERQVPRLRSHLADAVECIENAEAMLGHRLPDATPFRYGTQHPTVPGYDLDNPKAIRLASQEWRHIQ